MSETPAGKHSADFDAPPEMTAERLAANLRAAIKAAGLTQAEVAERVDMDPTTLSKALSGKRSISSLELALICTATGSDVLGILEADPLHGPSYRAGMAEAERRVGIPQVDPDGDYTGCGHRRPVKGWFIVCHLPIGHEGPHYSPQYWPQETKVIASGLPTHTLSEYGTTTCPIEHVRADVDDGICSACGYVFPSGGSGS